ncbi:MAG TPA: glutamate--tRNA ligase, partial [Candidatus Polarisedimenticolaceae bacterium]|nr:glutamate--tRNA ligase [Candidatus Polarisedimenticolaceae bacterium]
MAPERPLRVRFAPSPTGSLHLGNARTALFNWVVARQTGGCFLLRIEDTDREREQEGSEAGILEDLRWLGLTWDEGPEVGGPFAPYRQSERLPRYAAEAERLRAAGRAYRCFCSEEQLERERAAQRASGAAPRYSGRCRRLDPQEAGAREAAGEPFALRFIVQPDGADPERRVDFQDRLHGRLEFLARELGDPVILRRDGRPTYNFAVVVDDAAMRIDLVLRGDDHLSNTPRQVELYRALGHALPEFAHLPMVRGSDGGRLSKRHGAASVAEYRRLGYPVAGLLNALALLGFAPRSEQNVFGVDELTADFELGRVNRAPATFDPAKLDWICAQHLQRLPAAELATGILERLVAAGLLPEERPAAAAAWGAAAAELLRAGLAHLDQVPERA